MAGLLALKALDEHEQEYVDAKRGTMPDDELAKNIRQYRAIKVADSQEDTSNAPQSSDTSRDVPASDPSRYDHVPSLDEFLAEAKPLNKGVPENQLISFWSKNFGHTEDPKSLPTYDDFIKEAKPLNPDRPEAELKEYWQAAFGDRGARERHPGFGESILSGAKQGFYGLGTSAAGTVERLQSPDQHLKQMAHEAGDALEKTASQYAPSPELSQQPWYQRLTDKEYLGNLIGNVAVQSAPSLAGAVVGGIIGGIAAPGIGAAPGAAAGMVGVTYFQQAGSTYREAYQRYKADGLGEEVAHEKAYQDSGMAGLVSGVVNALAIPASLVAPFTGTLKNLALQYLLNVAVDTGDQATQNVVAKATFKPEQQLTEGIPEAVVGSGLLSAPETMAAVKSIASGPAKTVVPPITQPVPMQNIPAALGITDPDITVDDAIAKAAQIVATPQDKLSQLAQRMAENAAVVSGERLPTQAEVGRLSTRTPQQATEIPILPGAEPQEQPIIQPGTAFTPRQAPTPDSRAAIQAERERILAMRPAARPVEEPGVTPAEPIEPVPLQSAAELASPESDRGRVVTQLELLLRQNRAAKRPSQETPLIPGATSPEEAAIQPGSTFTPRQEQELTPKERMAAERTKLLAMRKTPTTTEQPISPELVVPADVPHGTMPTALDKAYPSVDDLHALAEAKGLEWDSNPVFMEMTKMVTGKSHLDDLTPQERQKFADRLQKMQGTAALSPTKTPKATQETMELPEGEPATEALSTFDAAQVPRSQLSPEQNAELLARAEKAQADLEIAGGERGGRYFKETQGKGSDQEVTGLKSATADWYKEATTGPSKLSRERVDKAVDKIIADKGRDVGADVQRIKELLLQDQEFNSSPFAPNTDEDWKTLIETATGTVHVEQAAHAAAPSPKNDLPEPTEAQKDAGNFQKGHIRIAGLDVSIENPAGSVRSGTDKNGKPWSQTMGDHYGYIRGTKGKDKDQIDVYLKTGTPADYSGPVFVVDQNKVGSNAFDEHKVVMGVATGEEARDLYLANHTIGASVLRSIKPFTMREFKLWLQTGDKQQPAGNVLPPAKVEEKGGFDAEAFDKREQSIKEQIKQSKASGMKHLDQLPFGVETQRGVRIKSIRDGSTGVVTAVTSFDDTNVQWDDKASSDNNMGSEEIVDGRVEYHSRLVKRDLPEFVVQPGGKALVSKGHVVVPKSKQKPVKPETAPPPKPLNMAGETRKEKPKAPPSPLYLALPAKTREKFEAAWTGSEQGDRPSIRTMKEWLYLSNKSLRAEFERRSGTKLPKGLAATNAAVEEYFGKQKVETVAPIPETKPIPAETTQPLGEPFTLKAETLAKPKPAKPVQQELAVPPETIGTRPIIGREVQPEEAPLFSKAAQTPDDVQTSLPEAKEPWQMTAEDVRRTPPMHGNTEAWRELSRSLVAGTPLGTVHRRMVSDALTEGQPVPAEVLADYPDLQAAEPKQEPTAILADALRAAADKIEGKPQPVAAAKKPPKAETAMVGLEDVGKKIGGARKDKWAERGLTLADLEGMTGGEEAKFIVKQNIWRPDYAAMVTAGTEPKAAAMVKLVYDQLAAKPLKDTEEGRRQYLTMMGYVKQALGAVSTVDDVKNAGNNIRYDLVGLPRPNGMRGTSSEDRAALQPKFDTFWSVVKGRHDPFHIGYSETARAAKMVEQGFPNQEPWSRRYEIKKEYTGELVGNLTGDGAKYYAERFLKLNEPWVQGQSVEDITKQIKRAGFYEIRERGSGSIVGYRLDEASAKARAQELYETKKDGADEGQEPVRPHLDTLTREGEDYRNGRDVTAEDFQTAFGFRGVEFGNWAASDERQKHINQAYDALRDMADVLGLPPKAISLNGTLGMAFGARGIGKFAAHYEPSKLVINITKINGPGSMAHEWGHGLDHYFGELDRPDAYKGAAKGASGWYKMSRYTGTPVRLTNLRPEMAQAFDRVMSTLFERNVTKAEAIRDTELNIEKIKKSLSDSIVRKEEAKDLDFKTRMQTFIDSLKVRESAAGRVLAKLTEDDRPEGGYGKVDTSFYKAAQTLSGTTGDYWKRPTEMFARSFESYVFDRLGKKSDYLVHGVEPDKFTKEKGYKENPYPAGVDRPAINGAFNTLFDTMQSKETPEGVALFERREPVAVQLSRNVQLLKDERFDMQQIGNRRFMFNPKTRELVFGAEEPTKRLMFASHAEEHQASGATGNYDDFVKGWIGTSKQYPSGVIHFAPGIQEKYFRENPDYAGDVLGTLELFARNGATEKTVLRNMAASGDRAWGKSEFKDLLNEAQFKPRDKSRLAPTMAQFAQAIDEGVSIGNTGQKVIDSSQQYPVGLIEQLASKPYVQRLSNTMKGIFDEIHTALKAADRFFGDTTYIGLSPDDYYVGVNLDGLDVVMLNPWVAMWKVQQHVKAGSIAEADTQEYVAGTLLNTIVHELTHQQVSTSHSDSATAEFDRQLAQNHAILGPTRLVGFQRRLMDVLTGGTTDELASDLDAQRQFWQGRDRLSDQGRSRDAESGATIDRANVAGEGTVGRTGPPADLRRGSGRETGALDRSPEFQRRDEPASVTHTTAFTNWFGNSKVVDANGKPLVVYHGTAASDEIKKFAGEDSVGWFAEDTELANVYTNDDSGEGGSVYPVFLSINNPLDLTDRFDSTNARLKLITIRQRIHELNLNYIPSKGLSSADPPWLWINDPRFFKALKSAGYDGVKTREGGKIAWAPISSNQIKSATGNRGTFDPTNPSINFERRDEDESVTTFLPATDEGLTFDELNSPDFKGVSPAEQRDKYVSGLTEAQRTALAHVHGTPKTWSTRLNDFKKNWKRELIQGLFDQYAPILDYSKKGYILARMAKGGDGTLEALLLYGKPYVDKDGAYKVDYTKEGGLQGFSKVMGALQGEHDRFLEWVAAQRAGRLKEIGLEHLYSDDDIAALKTLNRGSMPDGTSREKSYMTAMGHLNDWNDAMVKIGVDSGLISAEARDLFKNVPYVPFYRLQEDGVVQGFGMKAGIVNQFAWKRLKGGTEHLNDDLLANLLQNWSHIITASAKNRAAQETLTAAEQAGVAQRVPSSAQNKDQVHYLDGGQAVSFAVSDPALMDAIAALHYAGLGDVGKPFTAMKRYLSFAVTVNPAYKIRNLIRDSIQAIGTANLSYNPLKNIVQGAKATATTSETRAQLMAGGGMIRFGTMLDGNNADRTRRLINDGVDPGSILSDTGVLTAFWKRRIQPAFDAYQELGDRGEQINRAALYEQLKEKGLSHQEATFWARDLMDFSMSGKWAAVRILTQVVPFMGARLQGIYKIGRATKADYKRMGATLGAVALGSIALMLAYRDDDDWKKREDWDRENFWWFKVGDLAVRIPKPFEIGALGTIAERSVEYLIDQEMTGERFAERMAATVSNQLSMNPTPQLVKPLMDLYANQDSFTGRPIETMGMERMRKSDRATERTSEAARFLGSLSLPDPTQLALGRWETLSPVQVDSLVRGYFSWLGTTTTTVLDYGIRPFVDRGERPNMQLRSVFLAGNFVETLPSGSSRYLSQLYSQATEIEQAYASYRDALKRGDYDQARSILEDEKGKLAVYHVVEQIKRQESMLNERMKLIEGSRRLSGEEKRVQIDQIQQQKHQLARRVSERQLSIQ